MPYPSLNLSSRTADEIKTTTCYMCACRCGIKVHLKDGRIRYIEGNRSHPVNKGVLCAKGSAGIMQHYSPARLRAPMLRVGERGKGEFKEISWDEALELATSWLGDIRITNPNKLAFFTGRDQSQALTGWWAQQFGTVNYAAHGGFCSVNMAAAGLYTIGGSFWEFGEPDWEHTKYLLMFGVAEDHDSNPIKLGLGKLKGRGAKIVAINPIQTGYAAIADEWIGIRPGTDGLLVGALIHELLRADQIDFNYLVRYTNAHWLVIRNPGAADDGLFARNADGNPLCWDSKGNNACCANDVDISPAIVGEYTLPDGRKAIPAFQLLAERYLKPEYAPSAVAERTGISAETIQRIAAEIADVAFRQEISLPIRWTDWAGREHNEMIGRPVSFHAMRGISAHSNGFHTCRMLHILQMLLGAIDTPGSFRYQPPFPKPIPPANRPGKNPKKLPMNCSERRQDKAHADEKPECTREVHEDFEEVSNAVLPSTANSGVTSEENGALDAAPLGFVHGPEDLLIDENGAPQRIDKAFSWEYPLAAHGMMHTVIRNAWAGDPYPINTLFMFMANMSWNSAMNTKETQQWLADKNESTGEYKIPHIIYSDAYSSEMVAYADLILPDTTYLERYDCISLLDRPISDADGAADSIRQPIFTPDRDVRPFQSVLLDLGARLKLPGMVHEDGTPKYPGGFPDFMVNHERAPGIGLLAGWRGEKGDKHGAGESSPEQLQKYSEHNCFWHQAVPESARYYKMANRDYLHWAKSLGFIGNTEPIVLQIYSETLQKFRLAAQGYGTIQPPENDRGGVASYFDPLPFCYEPFEWSGIDQLQFPLSALTQRPMFMYHSWGSQNRWLRQIATRNFLHVHPYTAEKYNLEEGNEVWLESHNGRIRVPIKFHNGVEPGTVWTWNAIGKKKNAWKLTPDAPESNKGFLLNSLISDVLPNNSIDNNYANADPVTGQAACFEL